MDSDTQMEISALKEHVRRLETAIRNMGANIIRIETSLNQDAGARSPLGVEKDIRRALPA